ncbi:hypothetical protein C8Q80DRAFT_1357618 [Daedaleopsis nitida]|nr:hypothetical protein C8Q80DRAFT_1357618 [Daedaleopsis nitida]
MKASVDDEWRGSWDAVKDETRKRQMGEDLLRNNMVRMKQSCRAAWWNDDTQPPLRFAISDIASWPTLALSSRPDILSQLQLSATDNVERYVIHGGRYWEMQSVSTPFRVATNELVLLRRVGVKTCPTFDEVIQQADGIRRAVAAPGHYSVTIVAPPRVAKRKRETTVTQLDFAYSPAGTQPGRSLSLNNVPTSSSHVSPHNVDTFSSYSLSPSPSPSALPYANDYLPYRLTPLPASPYINDHPPLPSPAASPYINDHPPLPSPAASPYINDPLLLPSPTPPPHTDDTVPIPAISAGPSFPPNCTSASMSLDPLDVLSTYGGFEMMAWYKPPSRKPKAHSGMFPQVFRGVPFVHATFFRTWAAWRDSTESEKLQLRDLPRTPEGLWGSYRSKLSSWPPHTQ